MKRCIAGIFLVVSLTASTCSPGSFQDRLTGRWSLYDQKGGFRIQPHPMPVIRLEFSGDTYKKFIDDREVQWGSWTLSDQKQSGDTLQAKLTFRDQHGLENQKIRAIGKDAFVLDEDAPAYDGIAWYYRKSP